jgi:CRISPR-associated exonuclease Cas4
MLAVALLLLLVAVLLLWLAGHQRRAVGMPSGTVAFSDTDRRGGELFSSKRYGLRGKPDYVVYHNGVPIPVEVKNRPAPRIPFDSHVLQLAAYCLLVEEATGKTPPFGRLRYRDRSVDVPFSGALRRRLLETISSIRADLADPRLDPVPQHDDPRRCARCGYRDICSYAR